MSAAVRVETRFDKKARRCDDCEHAENQYGSNAFGELGDIPQIIRFLPHRVYNYLPESFKIAEWQLDRALLSPRVRRRDRGVRHIRQCQNSNASQKDACRGDNGYNN